MRHVFWVAIAFALLACASKRSGADTLRGAAHKNALARALASICGKSPGQMGQLFAGLVPGQEMPKSMQHRVAELEKQFKAHVHYEPGDGIGLSPWSLTVAFDGSGGVDEALRAVWGAPDHGADAWANPKAHVIAYLTHDATSAQVEWVAYHDVDELIVPSDKTKLGFEPVALVGQNLVDVEAALGDNVSRVGISDVFRLMPYGRDTTFTVQITTRDDVIVELRAFDWFTRSSEVGDELLDALAHKWGNPTVSKTGVHTWHLPGRTARASKLTGSKFEITISKS
jgi:hypothetical protein